MIGFNILIDAYQFSNQTKLVEKFTIERNSYKRQHLCFIRMINIDKNSTDRTYEMAHYDLYHQTIRELGMFDGSKKTSRT